jgi:hypothetical protein
MLLYIHNNKCHIINRIRVLYAVHNQNRNQKCKKGNKKAEDKDILAEVSAAVLQLYHRPIIPIKTMLIFQELGLRTQQAH